MLINIRILDCISLNPFSSDFDFTLDELLGKEINNFKFVRRKNLYT